MAKVSISDAYGIFTAAYEADDTIIMEGVHGIGKSESVAEWASEKGYHLQTLFLSHQEVGDLIGIPRVIEKDNEFITVWSKPIWLQRMEEASKAGKVCVLFLDELNRAPLDVRQAALQLVLERQIHEHSLPIDKTNKRTLVLAAMNPSDMYQADELDPALLDRFLYLDIKVDAPSWLNWARKHQINKVITSYISENPNHLHFQPKDGGNGATPRSWAKLSNYMNNINDINDNDLYNIMVGKLGDEIGTTFNRFFKTFSKVIKMEDVIKLIDNMSKNKPSIETIGEAVNELLSEQEAPQKIEMIKNIMFKYLTDKTPSDKEGDYILGILYANDAEILNSYLLPLRDENIEEFKKIVDLDYKRNNKKLFSNLASSFIKTQTDM